MHGKAKIPIEISPERVRSLRRQSGSKVQYDEVPDQDKLASITSNRKPILTQGKGID